MEINSNLYTITEMRRYYFKLDRKKMVFYEFLDFSTIKTSFKQKTYKVLKTSQVGISLRTEN